VRQAEQRAPRSPPYGHVVGTHIELVPNQRIVQAWRFPVWEPGTYSIVRFNYFPMTAARAQHEQHGEPDDWHDHIDTNWPSFYLTPLTNHFAARSAA
jgi:activator of HSP90 ATPase